MRRLIAGLICVAACGSSDASDPGPTSNAPRTSAVATNYMTSALNIMQGASINRYKINWPTFRTEALARIAGATTTADTYTGLRATLVALGDRHSFFSPPGSSSIMSNVPGTMSVASLGMLVDPSGRVLPNGLGYVSIPSFSGSGAQATAFADKLQDVVKTVDLSRPCGWIVDLRDNPGGNMWPMIAGIGPVLGAGDLGFFVDPDSVKQVWFYRGGAAGVRLRDGRESIVQTVSGVYGLAGPPPPVAVIYGSRTASSGEAVAVAFRARPLTRSFGTPTAGLSTANAGYQLSDGGTIFLTVAVDGDRSGKLYGDVLSPDQPATWNVIDPTSASDGAAQAASAWLLTQQACKT
jgi:carboxyl-terminal processing protease